MKRTWTIIGVSDVPGSFKWYQSLFGLEERGPRVALAELDVWRVDVLEVDCSGPIAVALLNDSEAARRRYKRLLKSPRLAIGSDDAAERGHQHRGSK